MEFLYKDNNGALVFRNFRVIIDDDPDPDVERFMEGKYKKYRIEYSKPPVYFKLRVESSLFSKKYVVEEAYYNDGDHEFYLETPITGKPAKIFAENFEEILENPKNIYVIPYLDDIGPKYSIENIPYRAYYVDEQYILEHGVFETLYILKKESYLETFSVDIQFYLGTKDVVSLFNGLFSCKEPNCVLENFPRKARIINTKRIMSRDIFDIINSKNVYALVHDDDTYYFLVKTGDGFVRFYTNPSTELIFKIVPESDETKEVNVEIKYYDFIDMLKRGGKNAEKVPE